MTPIVSLAACQLLMVNSVLRATQLNPARLDPDEVATEFHGVHYSPNTESPATPEKVRGESVTNCLWGTKHTSPMTSLNTHKSHTSIHCNQTTEEETEAR